MSVPFMQVYVADYTADVQHLSCEQDGAYWRILRAMWRAGGSLPDDDRKLANICGLTPSKWARIGADIMDLLRRENGVVTQKRLSSEIEKAQQKSQKRSEAGKRGAEAKALKNNETPSANAEPLLKHSLEPELEPEIEKNLPSVSPSGDTSPQGDAKPKSKRKSNTPKSKRCPEVWAPADKHRELVLELGLSAPQARLALDKFRDHEFRTPRTDWDATFSNWLRTEAERHPGTLANVRSQPHPDRGREQHQDRLASLQRGALAALNGRRERWGGAFDRPEPHPSFGK